ncbi:MAG: hypothetical protein JEZ03_13905 [Bacteroidales bacterium]|nr:hypothetical protein [Bacteroidales bacterium]
MKTRKIIGLIAICTLFMVSQSCEKEGNEEKISSSNSDESHNGGQNCMNCHVSGGDGEGWFQVAGTVYNEALSSVYPNATLKLYSGPNGTGDLKHSVKVDDLGNFYSTETITFGEGLYVGVQGTSTTKYMASKVTSGQCNSCHGSSTAKIWTK